MVCDNAGRGGTDHEFRSMSGFQMMIWIKFIFDSGFTNMGWQNLVIIDQ